MKELFRKDSKTVKTQQKEARDMGGEIMFTPHCIATKALPELGFWLVSMVKRREETNNVAVTTRQDRLAPRCALLLSGDRRYRGD